MQTSQFDIQPPKRPGLKKGQKHSGSFRKGHDPRRMSVKKYADGQTFRQLCQERSGEALELLIGIMQDEAEDKKTRMAAAIHVLDRGYGKPISGVALLGSDSDTTDPQSMSNAQLAAAAQAFLESAAAMGDLWRTGCHSGAHSQSGYTERAAGGIR